MILELPIGGDTNVAEEDERASLEKKPSARLSYEPCFGVEVNAKRPGADRRARLSP